MLRTLLILSLMGLALTVSAQSKIDELIQLARIYRNFHFGNNPTVEALKQLDGIRSKELQFARDFVAEIITQNNQIATLPYLTRPDSASLANLFIVRSINWNLHEADPMDNKHLIDSLTVSPASTYEQLSGYYGMVFTAIGNKNMPLNMAKVNFTMDDYKLLDDTERGIFFLEAMETFGMMIWGYMNVVKPPNSKKALEVIDNYPTFNSQPYYQFQDLNFKDFDLTTDKRKPKSSFKKYTINKYMNTLFYHSASLGQTKKRKKEQQDVLLGSIIKNESYYKYSDHPEIFQKIFQKVEEK